MTSTTASTILASDFSESTTDQLRDVWTLGKMRHVVAALEGRPVLIVLDKGTGFTMSNVRLTGVLYRTPGSFAGQGFVLVESTLDDGRTQETYYRLEGVGAIVDLEPPVVGGGVRFAAIGTYRSEVSAAIRVAQARHGEAEGRCWGSWKGVCVGTGHWQGVDVTYTPHTGNPAAAAHAGGHGERGFWRILAADMEAATV